MKQKGEYYFCDYCWKNEEKLTIATHIQEPDPFNDEINGDETPFDLCDDCYQERLYDI